MKIHVKLFGTLTARVPDHDPAHGLELEIPDGSSVKDLLARLDLPDHIGLFVSMESRVVTQDRILRHGDTVLVLQSLAGG